MADDGIGILMVEQNAEALDVSHEVVAITRGEVVFAGASDDARNHTSVLQVFLGEAALAGDGT